MRSRDLFLQSASPEQAKQWDGLRRHGVQGLDEAARQEAKREQSLRAYQTPFRDQRGMR